MMHRTRWMVMLGLAAAVLVAGCVSPPRPDTPDELNESNTATGVIQGTSLDAPQIFAGGSTQFILTLQNPRSQPLDRVTTTVGNSGNLQFTRRIPQQNAVQDHKCRYSQIPAGEATDPVTRRCIWDITAPSDIVGDARDSVTFPLTAFVTYSSTIPPEDSLRASFRPGQDIAPSDQRRDTARAGNNDVTVSVAHTSPVAAETGEIPVTVTVENVGTGTVMSGGQDRRGVTVRFGGTLADAQWNMQETTCTDGQMKRKTVLFHDTTQRTEISCTIVLAESSLAGKTFSLRPRADYRYRVTQDTPIRIESTS